MLLQQQVVVADLVPLASRLVMATLAEQRERRWLLDLKLAGVGLRLRGQRVAVLLRDVPLVVCLADRAQVDHSVAKVPRCPVAVSCQA